MSARAAQALQSAVKEREKGDWRQLCCYEKKMLYRMSFCQTFAEFQHPTGQWKVILGGVFFLTSFACWMMIFYHMYVCEPLPISLSRESQQAQLRRMLEIRTNPIDGISSLWDYDHDMWKWQYEEIRLKEEARKRELRIK